MILPSRWYESFGITIREAFRAKRPVIVSDIGAFKEAIRHLENGLLFPAGDVFELREMMDRLAQNPEMAEHLLEKELEIETLTDHCRKLKDLYQQAIQEKKARRKD